ncbi:MAG: hypothetical protein V3575_06545 [Candidatus Absconditabacteria bacterium]
MADVIFVSKTEDNIQEYKSKFIDGVKSCIKLDIIDNELGKIIISNIENQKKYIPREDVTSLKQNCLIMENNLELLNEVIKQITKIDQNKNITEKIFEIISIIDDYVKIYLEEEKTKEKINNINKIKELQEIENQKEIKKLEELLDNI